MEHTCKSCARRYCSRRAAGIVCRNYKLPSAAKKPVSVYDYAKTVCLGRVTTVRVTRHETNSDGDITERTAYDVKVVDYVLPGGRPARVSAVPHLTGGTIPALGKDETTDDSWTPVVVAVNYDEKLDPFQLALAVDGVELYK